MEGMDYFRKHVQLHKEEENEVSSLSERKLLEWYASRYLLHIMSGRKERGACLKDEYGKPYLTDSDYHISMSHSEDRIAVMASPHLVGIDIQAIVEKITRIARRFCNDHELSFIPKEELVLFLHFIWGAKECIYKAYGKRGVDFKNHMSVDAFQIVKENVFTTGRIKIKDVHLEFYIYGEIIDNYTLTYAVEKIN